MDRELKAVSQILAIMERLDVAERRRIISYVLDRVDPEPPSHARLHEARANGED